MLFSSEVFGGFVVLLPVFSTADVLAPSFMLVLSATVICCVCEIRTSLRVRTADRTFSVVLSVVTSSARISITWRDLYWVLDLQNDRGEPVISGIPLVTGADLLAQYDYMGLGFKLVVVCDDSTQDYPTKTDLGGRSHLLVSTE